MLVKCVYGFSTIRDDDSLGEIKAGSIWDASDNIFIVINKGIVYLWSDEDHEGIEVSTRLFVDCFERSELD